MLEMYGRELSTIFLEKNSSGSSIPIWSNSVVSMLKLEISFRDGWSGIQLKKHGCHLSNLRREWVNIKMPKLSYTDILNLILIWIPISRWPNIRSETGINRVQDLYLRELSLN